MWKYIINDFSLPRDLAKACDQRVIWLYYCELLNVSHHPTKFGGHRDSASGDLIVLVCHVILLDHVIKELCDFVVESHS